MPQLPFLEVEDLSSSLSFYSAIVEPLGLRHISTERGHFPSVTFGNSERDPVFQLRQVVASRDRPLRRSRIAVSAPSPGAADEAFEFAFRANPDLRDTSYLRHPAEAYPAASGTSAHRATTHSGGTRVIISDLDYNIMEIVYQPPFDYPPHYSGSTVRRTRSTDEEAGRILTWNFDVAGSLRPAPVGASSAYSGPPRADPRRSLSYHDYEEEEVEVRDYDDEDDHHGHDHDVRRPPPPAAGLKRSVTTGTSNYEPAASARENSTGLSAGAVVGTLLGVAGVAAGAALTYNMVRGDRTRASAHDDYDAPPFSRRSTFPDKYDSYLDRKGRYLDTERPADKGRYSDEYGSGLDYWRQGPDYVARYTQVTSPRSRDVDGAYDDARGRHSIPRSRASVRPRSEAANSREPYLLGEPEYRGYVSSKSSKHPPIVQRGYTYDGPERDSYVSSRSQRSSNTLRASPADAYLPSSHPVSHSRSGSRVTTTTYKVSDSPRGYSREEIYGSARHIPFSESRASPYTSARDPLLASGRAPPYLSAREATYPSDNRAGAYYSARHAPLPRSSGGSSRARYGEDDDDDDADSIAPSDSISCVGSRRSR
ncbi:uncharacterized protein QC763_505470 [Podospora pseudopauciseta]|uniref:VOC domain-containing protein n=1 Tax=Podospora pseudopauciseta TaxID=2093780 RepID=A0ABR0H973_9PEZI|nr:hypothetical protein QC763_505470 [Podospora pseudopauciseta]